MLDPTTISALTALAATPAPLDRLAIDDVSDAASKYILAQYMRSLAGSVVVTSPSIALEPFAAYVFGDATARAITFTGAPAFGWLLILVAQVTAASHTAKLPAGVTYNGTDNTATFNGADDVLILLATSATRYQVLLNTSVTFSTT